MAPILDRHSPPIIRPFNPDQPAIQTLALSIANTMTFGDFLDLN